MAMARSDIEVALRDGIAAAQEDRPDFTYRVRLATSHLVEALDSLNAYSQEDDIKRLIARATTSAQKQLTKARSVLQRVGPKVLDQVRNSTSTPRPRRPATHHRPTSSFETCWSACARPCEMHLDHRSEQPVITLAFAGDIALALALAKHSADEEVGRQQFEMTSEGAVAFERWADALLATYLGASGGYVGKPRMIESPLAPPAT